MFAVLDCDILSTFAKVNKIGLLEKLFPELLMPYAVYVELTAAQSMGFDFPERVFESKVKLTTPKPNELTDFEIFVKMPQVHHGESEGMSIAKNRNAVFLTNDRKAVQICEEKEIMVLDLKDILRQIARENLADKEEMQCILEDIENMENTIIKEKEEIFEEYAE